MDNIIGVGTKGRMQKGISLLFGVVLVILLIGCSADVIDHLSLAEEYLSNKQYEQAVFEFYEYSIANPDDPRAYQGSAEAYLAMGEKAKAIEQYELLIKNFPKNPDGYHELAAFLEGQQVINLYTAFISETPDSITGYLFLGEYYKEIGDTEAAQTLYLDIMSMFPNAPEAYIEVGLYYFDIYRYQTAIAVLMDGIRLTDDDKVIETYNFVASHIVVEWQDPYIETVIRNYLDNPNGAITLNHLSDIHTIEINGSKVLHRSFDSEHIGVIEINGELQSTVPGFIENLEDFSFFINLKELHIHSYPLEGISSLTNLNSLEVLAISDTYIKDIGVLSSMATLRTLILEYNEIVSIESLKSLKNLTTLSLSGNWIVDISALSELPSLKTLRLADNKINDLLPIIGVHDLELFDIRGNKIKDEDQLTLIVASQILYKEN